jgi:hypothetical protein
MEGMRDACKLRAGTIEGKLPLEMRGRRWIIPKQNFSVEGWTSLILSREMTSAWLYEHGKNLRFL